VTSARRLVATLLALGAVTSFLALGSGSRAVAEDHGAQTESAQTKSGAGRFADLDVTVSQTTHLRNQVVRVSWTGGRRSTTSGRNFLNNYVQIMQCWGDEDGPQREKCQYGGIFDDQRGGQATSNREIVNNGQLDDPAETEYTAPFPATAVVPFESVTGDVVKTRRNPFFDSQSTNEIDYGRTSADGTGEEFFEVQTGLEAAGLGCGSAKGDGTPRDCWLVVVPRDDKEVNGLDVGDTPTGRLESSPLSTSNFANAISFRLSFDSVELRCPMGQERRVLGNEEVSEAFSRWQPAMCAATGSPFGFSQLGDELARQQALTDEPWLSLVDRPINPEANTDGRLLTYAPMAISGIGVGVVIERYPRDGASDEAKAKRGTRVLDLNLNARLVAKLLTQTYVGAVLGDRSQVAGNPRRLTDDKEFLKLNPEFDQLQYTDDLFALTNPLGRADAIRAVWEWIQSDPDAKAFIDGATDPWGTKVNPFYKGTDLNREDFPRSDPSCDVFTDGRSPLCTLDHLAYAADFHTAARAAIRGMTLGNDNWDWGPPARYKQNPAQAPGERAVLALVDTATAARFQVSMARLQNAAGKFVAPTEDAMDAAVAGMKDSAVPGVLATNPGTRIRAAYPLTQVTYAVTAPRQLSTDDAEAYAALLRYAAGPGQTPGLAPGQLPEGYLPLNDDLRAQTRAAADVIAKRGGPAPAAGTDEADEAGSGDPGASPVAAAPIGAVVPLAGAPAGTTTPAEIVPASATTPTIQAGATRFALVGAALLGLLAVASRPVLAATGAYRRWRAARPSESSR
jgi:hypothetical protein